MICFELMKVYYIQNRLYKLLFSYFT